MNAWLEYHARRLRRVGIPTDLEAVCIALLILMAACASWAAWMAS